MKLLFWKSIVEVDQHKRLRHLDKRFEARPESAFDDVISNALIGRGCATTRRPYSSIEISRALEEVKLSIYFLWMSSRVTFASDQIGDGGPEVIQFVAIGKSGVV
jgi:hypothetical protein